jgi:hypothetical protein
VKESNTALYNLLVAQFDYSVYTELPASIAADFKINKPEDYNTGELEKSMALVVYARQSTLIAFSLHTDKKAVRVAMTPLFNLKLMNYWGTYLWIKEATRLLKKGDNCKAYNSFVIGDNAAVDGVDQSNAI